MDLQAKLTKPPFYKGFFVRMGTFTFFPTETKVLCWVPPLLYVLVCHICQCRPSAPE